MHIYLSAAVALIGLLMWIVGSNPYVKDAGKIMFGAGLFVFLLSSPQVGLGGR